MAGIKSLVKDTAVYGLSSIGGRFLNWLLVPLYVYFFPANEYGIVSYLYSFTAVALVVLNYGMETGFFRFANRSDDPERVYTTTLWSVGSTSLLFILLLTLFLPQISSGLLLPKHPEYVWLLGTTVAIDAFTNLPFAYLRYKNKAWTFAGVKFLNIGVNIFLNIFFIIICPRLQKVCPAAIDWFYEPIGGFSYGIGWIFIANIISTLVNLLVLLPYMAGRRWRFDPHLLSKMLDYSWPLLILGVAGIASQNMGQIVIPYLFRGSEEAAREMVGIYGANIKIAVVMVMFTQAFRYAYEPFIFAQARAEGEDRKRAYCDAMKYFVIFGLLIFLGVMYFLPLIRHFIAPAYWSGLRIVPIMMIADLFSGIFFNLSLWYKLTDRTRWGMYFSLICFALMFGLNVWFVRLIGIPDGYIGSAWAAFISYFVVMLLSYIVGRYYYPLPYQIGRMTLYGILAVALYLVGEQTQYISYWLAYPIRILLLCGYLCVVAFYEDLPIVSKPIRGLVRKYIPRKASAGKRSNISEVFGGWMRQLTPRKMARNERDMLLNDWEMRPDADIIRDRVNYYCQSSYSDENAQNNTSDFSDYNEDLMPVRTVQAGQVTPISFRSHYVYDLNRWLRAWPADTPLRFVDGDVHFNPSLPTLMKARRLDDKNQQNANILNLDSRRHFLNPYDPIPFSRKKSRLIFRGECSGKPERERFLNLWKNSEFITAADTSAPYDAPLHSHPIGIPEHFNYKFVLALEGYDVASALQWIMASNCVPVMVKPHVEGWLMHGRLKPGVHYIEISSDFSDVEDKIRYYSKHPEEAEKIAKASTEWARQFSDPEREAIIHHLILQRYFKGK